MTTTPEMFADPRTPTSDRAVLAAVIEHFTVLVTPNDHGSSFSPVYPADADIIEFADRDFAQWPRPVYPALTVPYTEEQIAAVEEVLQAVQHPGQLATLTGPAGTGKTAVTLLLLHKLPGAAFVAAFTWKAVHNINAIVQSPHWGTLHGITYVGPAPTLQEALTKIDIEVDDLIAHGKLDASERAHEIQKRLAATKVNDADKLVFGATKEWTAETFPPFLVVDEASMVGTQLLADLRKALPSRTSIIAVGDPFQLPPVQDDAGFNLQHPTAALTKVHRQKEGSKILNAVTEIRECGLRPDHRFWLRHGIEVCHGTLQEVASLVANHVRAGKEIAVLTGNHELRRSVNDATRTALGFPATATGPCAGDRILARATAGGLYNAEMGVIIWAGTAVSADRTAFAIPEEFQDNLTVANGFIRAFDVFPLIIQLGARILGGGVFRYVWNSPAGPREDGRNPKYWNAQVRAARGYVNPRYEAATKYSGHLLAALEHGEDRIRATFDALSEACKVDPLGLGLPARNGTGLSICPGYAVTPWVAQGSQYETVVLLQSDMRWLKAAETNYWYTAASRAKQRLIVVPF